ncbi:Vps51/Vps67 protein [Toxoplasma gondii ME49]|uniref:Vps51/Vps67 domain containing protein,putative n=4 Tax=Toxoplasma gondii TaxID=5811 RepID=B6KR65_TOXGV|nr:Vps51/Vps67 protein [Toxoplasma gondii ME49]EPT27399.1 Vps51/Vps67 protein [Toxoplasma gondii ME49]ESS29068.1 Vps51/Vps67 protein [Toxoplasma gondii VEG]KYF44777.1 Vps51/Vps67 protein [Toxoplasma gondii ARI]CEL76216.1 TPA: Vps51/Vps67 domain containing protein,putative [Toxoplasma gondii VEG]|eukprot:XP_002370338.1 Vps51/Vps67 protein [Toxoplasma gondii ME49]
MSHLGVSGSSRGSHRKSKVGALLSEYYNLDEDNAGDSVQPPSGGVAHPSGPRSESLNGSDFCPVSDASKSDRLSAASAPTPEKSFRDPRTRGRGESAGAGRPESASRPGEQADGAVAPQQDGKADLDSENFDVHAYFASAVQTSSLRELLRRSGQLDEEVRRAEGELQTLVYENYGKFLDAAETVRCVKEDMRALRGHMVQLDSRVDSIEGSSRELDELVRDRAASIEELVSFRQLLDKLQILFTFPEVLRRHLANGDAESVLSIYLHIHPFLQAQQAALPRLQRLKLLDAEATSVFRCAKRMLRQRLESPAADGSSRELQAASLAEDLPVRLREAAAGEPLASKDASKILSLLLQAEDEDRASLLKLYHRSRTHALLDLIQWIFDQDRLQREAAENQRRQDQQVADASAAEASALLAQDEPRGRGSAEELKTAASLRMLEVACSTVSEHLMGPLVDAVHDTLRVLREETALGAENRAGGSLVAGRSLVSATKLKPEAEELSPDGAAVLQEFLTPVLRSVFGRVLALLASTNPPAASVVAAVDSLRVALRRLHAVLPPAQQQQLSKEFLAFSDKLLQQEIALAFKESYMRAAQELRALELFCLRVQPRPTRASQASAASRDPEAETPPLDDSKTEEALQQLARTEHAVLLQGCLTLTDVHQIVNGVCGVKSAQADRLVSSEVVAWTEGFFSLFVHCLLRLTRDTPAALQERDEQRLAAEELREDELAWREKLEEEAEEMTARNRDGGLVAARAGKNSRNALPRLRHKPGLSAIERQVSDAVRTAIFTHLVCEREGAGPGSQFEDACSRREETEEKERDCVSNGTSNSEGFLDEGRNLFCLLMMRMGRHLELQGLGKLAAVAVELFPSFPVHRLTASSVAGPLSASDAAFEEANSEVQSDKTQSLLLRTRWASQAVLTTYVFHRGLEGASLATRALKAFDCLQSLQERCGDSADDSAEAEEFRRSPGNAQSRLQVSGLFDPLLRLLHRCDAECAKLLGERRQGGGGTACALMPSSGAGGAGEQPHQRRMARLFGRRRTAIEREMERLFARKQAVFSPVPFNRAKAIMGIFRIASRALIESVRMQLFSRCAVRQIQVDCAAAAELIRDLVAAEDGSVVDGLLDEVTALAALRCVERPQKRVPLAGRMAAPGAAGAAAAAAAVAAATAGIDPELDDLLLEQSVVEEVCKRSRRRPESFL